jgi:hypothetical protein
VYIVYYTVYVSRFNTSDLTKKMRERKSN